jgi:hypothetical protein
LGLSRTRKSWHSIIKRAAAIVEQYDTAVTLRQLFYRLVARRQRSATAPSGRSSLDHEAADD